MGKLSLILLIILMAYGNNITQGINTSIVIDGEKTIPWNLNIINSTQIQQYSQGDGIVIAILDTGIDFNHPDIKESVWQNEHEIVNGIDDDNNGYVDDISGWDFYAGDNYPEDQSSDSHGTHVAGVISGVNNGIAYKSKLMILKVIGPDGGSVENLVMGIYYAVEKDADIISMSLAGSDMTPLLEAALKYAHENGVIMVGATGNEGVNAVDVPARAVEVIAVGSISENGLVSDFSNQGTQVFAVAPGNGINSTVRLNFGLHSDLVVQGIGIHSLPMEYSNISNIQGNVIFGGSGTIEELSLLGLNNSIVLIERGKITFEQMALNVRLNEGLGMIVYNDGPEIFTGTLSKYSGIVAVSVSGVEGLSLKNETETLNEIIASIEIAPSNYSVMSGTSMAVPHVSGFISLILSYYRAQNTNKSLTDIIEIFRHSLTDLGIVGRDRVYGYGLLNGEMLSAILLDKILPTINLSIIDIQNEGFNTRLEVKIVSQDNLALNKFVYSTNGNQEVLELSVKSTMIEFSVGIDIPIDEQIITFKVDAYDISGNIQTEYIQYEKGVGVISDSSSTTSETSLSIPYTVILIIICF